MADRIRADFSYMQELAEQIKHLASRLSALESQTRSVPIAPISGANVKVNVSSGTLQSIGCSIHLDTAENGLFCVASCLQNVGQYAEQLSSRIDRVWEEFRLTEQSLIKLYNGSETSNSSLTGMPSSVSYDALPSFVTDTIDSSILRNARIIRDNDILGVFGSGIVYLFGKSGLLAAHRQIPGFMGVKEASRLYFNHLHSTANTNLDNSDFTGSVRQMPSIGSIAGPSISALSSSVNYSQNKHTAQISGGLLNANASAEGNAGISVSLSAEEDAGCLTIGAGAEMGASVSVAQAEASYKYELCDMIDLSADASVQAVGAEAKLGGGIGIIDNEFDSYIEASAEANLIKAEASGSIDIAGIKGTIGGSVNYGIGAHAKFGLDDGVLVMDAGASYGAGAGVRFELDLSEAITNIGNTLLSLSDTDSITS